MCTHICTDSWQIMILKTHWRVIGYKLIQIPIAEMVLKTILLVGLCMKFPRCNYQIIVDTLPGSLQEGGRVTRGLGSGIQPASSVEPDFLDTEIARKI